jgi:hypothetical protein
VNGDRKGRARAGGRTARARARSPQGPTPTMNSLRSSLHTLRSCLNALRSVGAVLLLVHPTVAHDFWMQPSSYRPEKAARVDVALFVGDFGRGDAVPRNEARIVKFAAATPDGEQPIVGRDGAVPAGFLRPRSEGLHVLGFQSNAASVTLEPEKFAAYLDERGLDAIRRLRDARGDAQRPAREVYSRSAKALLRVGDAAASGWDRPLDLALELSPAASPFALSWKPADGAFETLPIQLAFRGKPLAGALVCATCLDAPPRDALDTGALLRARTDAEGRVAFRLPRGGKWLFASVHMLALEDRADADFESFWASLTLELESASR